MPSGHQYFQRIWEHPEGVRSKETFEEKSDREKEDLEEIWGAGKKQEVENPQSNFLQDLKKYFLSVKWLDAGTWSLNI